MRYEGEGVLRNVYESIALFTEAADQGYAQAQYYLGLCYLLGITFPENKKLAKEYFEKAAEQGHERAKAQLESME